MLGYHAPRRKTMDPLCNPGHAGLWASIGPDILKGLPAAFVALVIGMIAAAIASRQFLVAKAKLNLDLFEKRYAVYELLWKHLTHLTGAELRSVEAEYSNAVPTAYFLFGPEIGKYMEDIRLKGFELVQAKRIANTPGGDSTKQTEADAKIDELEVYLFREIEALRARFAKYMDFAEWH
jgi:hypothetical protein